MIIVGNILGRNKAFCGFSVLSIIVCINYVLKRLQGCFKSFLDILTMLAVTIAPGVRACESTVAENG